MRAYIFVLCLLSVNFVFAVAYKGGIILSSNNDVSDIAQLVREAGTKNVDVLVLPSDVTNSEDNYDEMVKNLSKAAKQAGLYLVANLNERTVCQKKPEIVRSNLVFDREGAVVCVYRKPVTTTANCTTNSGPASFTTDFGVTFGVKMEDDLMLQAGEAGWKDYVVAGSWATEIALLSGAHFTPSWAYTSNANVLSSHGIFAGKAGAQGQRSGDLLIADLNVDKVKSTKPPIVTPSLQNYPGEDLSQYIIRPLDVEASTKGYKETVCHQNFCCEFNVKTSYKGAKQEVNYGLAAFDGVRHYGGSHYIGAKNCGVFACAGLYKRSCGLGLQNNNTDITFEKLSITAKYDQHSVQYPLILSNEASSSNGFIFNRNQKEVITEIYDADNLLAFGIVGRNFAKDFISSENQDGVGIYDYIFNEDVVEFFDYLWIRLRVLIFIVSIYVLEMM